MNSIDFHGIEDLVLAFYLFSFVADRHPGGLPLCSETL